jgi:type II secretory pathway pseudopilin PulG
MNIRRRRDAGFTLLELMITAAFTAIIMGLGFGLLTTAQQIAVLQQEQSAATRDSWIFVDRLSRELREAMPPSQLGEGAEWRGTSASAKLSDLVSTERWSNITTKEFDVNQPVSNDMIQFGTLRAGSPSQPPGPGLVEYSLKRDEKSNVVDIVRRSAAVGVSLEKAETQVIGPSDPNSSLGFVSLQFQYLDAQGKWLPGWTEGKSMPRAVRVSVSTLLRPSRQVRVPVIYRYSTQVDLATDSRIPQ